MYGNYKLADKIALSNARTPSRTACEKMYIGVYTGKWEELSGFPQEDIRGMHRDTDTDC